MMKRIALAAVFAGVVFVSGCTETSPCGDGPECPADQICVEGSCLYPCVGDKDCDPDYFCKDGVCWLPECGNGLLEGDEECDTGVNNADSSACTTECRLGVCGDGLILAGQEQCDDGNDDDTDACVECRIARCGDGAVRQGVEACDDGNTDNTDACLVDCVTADCGDGVIWAGREECDNGSANANDGACKADCSAQRCGDGFVGPGEGCDDGNTEDGDDCTSECALASCGNGVREGEEECDDDNSNNTDECLNTCVWATCGDGYVRAGSEACDDGNGTLTDACPDGADGTCQVATCGDGFVHLGVEACDDADAVEWDGCTGCQISEVRISDVPTGIPGEPRVAMNGQGSFVVVWTDAGVDGDGKGVVANRFDSSGGESPAGDFVVNTATTDDQEHPSVAMNSGSGDYVVAWQAPSAQQVRAQRFSASGPTGTELLVNSQTVMTSGETVVGADDSGNFTVYWEDFDNGIGDLGVYAQRFDSTGADVGGTFRVNTSTTYSQQHPAVATHSDGRSVVVWQTAYASGPDNIKYQRSYANGTANGSEMTANTYTGEPQTEPAVAMSDDGDFVVAWERSDGDGSGIRALRFYDEGGHAANEILVNTYTPSDQRRPAVAMSPLGDFVVVWESDGQDGSGTGIFARRFDSTDDPDGIEFRINTYTPGNQSAPQVAADHAGRFVVVWQSYGQGVADWQIFGQRFDAEGRPCPACVW